MERERVKDNVCVSVCGRDGERQRESEREGDKARKKRERKKHTYRFKKLLQQLVHFLFWKRKTRDAT